MPFDVFALRDQVVGEYQRYVKSFINILDHRLSGFVTAELIKEGSGPILSFSSIQLSSAAPTLMLLWAKG